MRKSCTVSVNGQRFTAKRGDLILDAGLASGIELPHDCRSGHCGTCRVAIVEGLAYGGECNDSGMVKACQARVITDLKVLVEPVPDVVTTKGIVTGVRPLAPDIVEVRISLAESVDYLSGQYYKFMFEGYPWRCFSPTAPMTGQRELRSIRLHVRRIPDGRVSSALGAGIVVGHRVKLQGPFGTSYLRPNRAERLVLLSSGTGFAPIWSILSAAIEENPRRNIVLIVGAKTDRSLYMGPAVRGLSDMPNVVVLPVAEELGPTVRGRIRRGRPTDHMPALGPSDLVYACGAPKMVDAAKARAVVSRAIFYADPFVPQTDSADEGAFSRAMGLIRKVIPQASRQPALPHADSVKPKMMVRRIACG